MPGALLSRRLVPLALRAGRAAAFVVALVAFLHVTAPHHHAGAAEERYCPACQVSRLDGAGVPETEPVTVAPPARTELPAPAVAVVVALGPARSAPLPSRGPPAVLSATEPL